MIWGLLALPVGSTFMGCVITRDPGYSSRPNTPPVVLEDPALPFASYIDVFLDRATASDGGMSNPDRVLALVRDPDVDQNLEGILFLDRRPEATENRPLVNEFLIPGGGGATRRVEQVIDFGGAEFTVGCHVLELHVSTLFRDRVTNPQPVTLGDLGRGIWFVRVFENDTDDTPLRGCESAGERDAGMTP